MKLRHQIIDIKTGQVRLANAFIVSKQTTPEQIIGYFGLENVDIRDVHSGWKHYSVRNAKISATYFNFTFYFENDTLKMVDFKVSDKLIVASFWDDWSEKKELEDRDYYNDWLTKEIGENREFHWGTIGSFYDNKGGSSSIVLKYE